MRATQARRTDVVGAVEHEPRGLSAIASPAMRAVMEQALRAAATDIPVLIEGESGVGKEWLARAIHAASPRAKGPMVTLNCGAIPEKLVESILFGHERGAFTGATERHAGKFAEANEGTLFLDEIGELPAEAQVKLLRAVQEGEVEAVGAKGPRRVDVRIVSATNRRLAQEVAEGRFREDLFYRLGVFPVAVPPLRERREDIPALAQGFVERFAETQGTRARTLSPGAVLHLEERDWPGNIRELENVVFRAAVLSDRETLSAQDFTAAGTPVPVSSPVEADALLAAFETVLSDERGPDERRRSDPRRAFARRPTIDPLGDNGEMRSLAAIERAVIEMALERYDGRMSRIARTLGIGRSTLYRKLREYGLGDVASA